MRKLPLIAALLLSCVAAISQWSLYYSISDNTLSGVIGGLIVAGILSIKISLSANVGKGRLLIRGASIVLLALIMCLSVFAEVLFFKGRLGSNIEAEKTSDARYLLAMSSIRSTQSQIEVLVGKVSECNAGWEKKCIKPKLNEINRLRSMEESMMGQLHGMKSLGETGQVWESAGNLLGVSTQNLQWIVFIFIGILLDMLSIFGFYLYSGCHKPLDNKTILEDMGDKVDKVDVVNFALTQAQDGAIMELKTSEQTENNIGDRGQDYDKARTEVMAGRIKPAVSAVRRLLRMQHKEASAILMKMADDGFLELSMRGSNRVYTIKNNVVDMNSEQWVRSIS